MLSLWRVMPDDDLLESAKSMTSRIEELFADKPDGKNTQGYFYTQASEDMLFRVKSGDDSSVPNAIAIMLNNLIDLYEITKDGEYLEKAKTLANVFLNGNDRPLAEFATMMMAALKLESVTNGGTLQSIPAVFDAGHTMEGRPSPDDVVAVSVALFPADPLPGSTCELMVTCDIKDGWHINANKVTLPYLIATQLDIQGEWGEVVDVTYPEPLRRPGAEAGQTVLQYEGLVTITAKIRIARDKKRLPIKVMLRFQPCHGTSCHAIRDVVLNA
jgi:hypothetical protein